MAPREPSVSTTSSSLLSGSLLTNDRTEDCDDTEDDQGTALATEAGAPSIDVVSLDDPSRMSPGAIMAELQYYGVRSPPSSEDRMELERALVQARRHHKEGLGEHQQMQYRAKSHRKLSPDAVPGMRVKTPAGGGRAHVVTSPGGAGENATHIPLIAGNKIPPQILTVIRTSADPTMKAINLDHKPLGDAEVAKLADALAANRTVAFLSLRRCRIGDAGAAHLGDMLATNDTLIELHLDGNALTAEGAAALSTALITNEALAVLTLNDNPAVGDRGVSYLVGALEHNATLRTLAVHNAGAGRGRLANIDDLLRDRQADANFDSLLERLSDDDFRVTGIDLSGRRIGDRGAARLAEALADNTQVRQLWLRGCNLGDEGAKALASCLEQNMAVVDLFLGNNRVGNAGLVALSDALARSNLTLVSLELDDNNVGEAGIDAFVRALEKNASVLVASFENNPLGGAGASKLAKIERALAEKRDGLNLVSFVVDPDAGGSTVGEGTAGEGVVNMSVCSSYMPSTYRRAGFSSQAGGGDDLRRSGESHRYSVYHRDSSGERVPARSPGRPPPKPPQARPLSAKKDSPPASITFSKSSKSRTSSSKSPRRSHTSSRSPRRSRSSSKSPRRARADSSGSPKTEDGSGGSPKTEDGPARTSRPKPTARPAPAPPKPVPPKARPASPPPFARAHAKSTPYSKAHVPVPLKAQALETIAERSAATSISDSRGIGGGTKKGSSAFASDLPPVAEGTAGGTSLTTPLIGKRKDADTVGHTTISESIAHPQTQKNFDTTLKKLWRRVEMMKRTNHFAAAHYRARHFTFWFVPMSTCLGLSVLLSLACALSASARVGLSLSVGFFAFVAFGLNFLQARCGWSGRAEVHRAAYVELTQVAFRLDTLGKYEGSGLTAGAHSTKSRSNAIRDLYRIDVYLQAMQRCTPEAPATINEVFYLLASRLKGICQKYPHAVKLRSAYALCDEDPDAENPVPVEMQIDALDLLGREIESYFLYPLFLPNAKEVVSRTIDIFFAANPEGGTTSAPEDDQGTYDSVDSQSQSFLSYEDDDLTEIV